MSDSADRDVPGSMVDVLIVTAMREEYEAALDASGGALPGSVWEKAKSPTDLEIAFRSFAARDGHVLRVGLTRALWLSGVAGVEAVAPLVETYRPRVVALTGIVSGRRGAVELGDVIVADGITSCDAGPPPTAREEREVRGRAPKRISTKALAYEIAAPWRRALAHFQLAGRDETEGAAADDWPSLRPIRIDAQMDWVLARIAAGEAPATHPDRARSAPDYAKALDRLKKQALVHMASLLLTDAGRRHVTERRMHVESGVMEAPPLALRVGALGTLEQLFRDPLIFERLPAAMSDVLGLEMASAALAAMVAAVASVAATGNFARRPYLLLVKGVADFGDTVEHDNFAGFAARAATECLIAFVREHFSLEGERARALGDEAAATAARGDHAAAIRITDEALVIYRKLAVSHPEEFRGELAGSLESRAAFLLARGEWERALATANEAIDLSRVLAASHVDEILPTLADSLEHRGRIQHEIGERVAAVDSMREVVALTRTLAASHHENTNSRAALAARLAQLGRLERNANRREAALAAMQEAVETYWTLVDGEHAAYLPQLAATLNNLGGMQGALGHVDEAAEAMEQATEIYRSLADARPDPFLPALAMSVFNLGSTKDDLGRREESLESTLEAAELFRGLADTEPATFLPALAMSLVNLAKLQNELGQSEAALDSTRSAVAIYRRLAAAGAEATVNGLAGSLENLSRLERERAEPLSALAALEEAVDLRRGIAGRRPGPFNRALALALQRMGDLLGQLGRLEGALRTTQEALDLSWPRFVARPDAHAEEMAETLRLVHELSASLGRVPGAEMQDCLRLFSRLTAGEGAGR